MTADINHLADSLKKLEARLEIVERALGIAERPESDLVAALREEIVRANTARTDAIDLLESVQAMHGRCMTEVGELRARVAAADAEVAKVMEMLAIAIDCIDLDCEPRPGFFAEARALLEAKSEGA